MPVSDGALVAYVAVEITGYGWREDPQHHEGYDIDPSRAGKARIRHLRSGIMVGR